MLPMPDLWQDLQRTSQKRVRRRHCDRSRPWRRRRTQKRRKRWRRKLRKSKSSRSTTTCWSSSAGSARTWRRRWSEEKISGPKCRTKLRREGRKETIGFLWSRRSIRSWEKSAQEKSDLERWSWERWGVPTRKTLERWPRGRGRWKALPPPRTWPRPPASWSLALWRACPPPSCSSSSEPWSCWERLTTTSAATRPPTFDVFLEPSPMYRRLMRRLARPRSRCLHDPVWNDQRNSRRVQERKMFRRRRMFSSTYFGVRFRLAWGTEFSFNWRFYSTINLKGEKIKVLKLLQLLSNVFFWQLIIILIKFVNATSRASSVLRYWYHQIEGFL